MACADERIGIVSKAKHICGKDDLSTKRARIYIAGKISGENPAATEEKFAAARNYLKEKYSQVIDPYQLIKEKNELIVLSGGRPWDDINDRQSILKFCIWNLMDCQAIYLLPDWQESRGALIEAQIAKALDMEIINA